MRANVSRILALFLIVTTLAVLMTEVSCKRRQEDNGDLVLKFRLGNGRTGVSIVNRMSRENRNNRRASSQKKRRNTEKEGMSNKISTAGSSNPVSKAEAKTIETFNKAVSAFDESLISGNLLLFAEDIKNMVDIIPSDNDQEKNIKTQLLSIAEQFIQNSEQPGSALLKTTLQAGSSSDDKAVRLSKMIHEQAKLMSGSIASGLSNVGLSGLAYRANYLGETFKNYADEKVAKMETKLKQDIKPLMASQSMSNLDLDKLTSKIGKRRGFGATKRGKLTKSFKSLKKRLGNFIKKKGENGDDHDGEDTIEIKLK